MTKSIYVVAGIGLFGCVALSFLMQHLLEVQGERSRSPVAIELQEMLADNLRGPVEVSTHEVDGERTMVVRMPAREGVPLDLFAKSATDLLWRRSPNWKEVPEKLRLEVDAPGATAVVLDSRPPGVRRTRADAPSRVRSQPVSPPK